MVELTVNLPESVAEKFGDTPALAARHLLESAAVEGYRSRKLSRHQVREMLGLSWVETEAFLSEHGCPLDYSLDDLEEDRQTLALLARK